MHKQFTNIIRLLSVQGVGPRRTMVLYKRFGSLENIFTADTKQLLEIPGITQKTAQAILSSPDEYLLSGQIKLAEKYNVDVITIWDDQYPLLLKQIYDPPPVLFYSGNLDLLNTQSIAIVGTRTPTAYGKEITREFTSGLAHRGYTLVSGAAKGIDTVVHTSSLKVHGNTIAVLGNGIDRVYPAENRSVYHAISDHGLLISEFLMGTKPDAPNFPRRNRIISGLSSGTLVIEAADRSGSLITAYFALDQNREVFAIPGSIKSRMSRGTHQLIRQGAKLVETVDDILDELGEKYHLGQSSGQQELSISLEPKEAEILKHLRGSDPVQIDALADLSGQTTFSLLGQLLQMEMKGLVQQYPGKYFKSK